MTLPPHPLFDQSHEVLEEFMKSFDVPNAAVTSVQIHPPPLHYPGMSFVILP
jgi:hypothetical protein